jgi:hypothetical protein
VTGVRMVVHWERPVVSFIDDREAVASGVSLRVKNVGS